jgi:hypothetical protein
LPPNPNIFIIIPPSEPDTHKTSSAPSYINRMNTDCHRERFLPPGGYILPLLSICGPQPHRWFSGTESRTEGIWEPHPNHVAPPVSVVRFLVKGFGSDIGFGFEEEGLDLGIGGLERTAGIADG